MNLSSVSIIWNSRESTIFKFHFLKYLRNIKRHNRISFSTLNFERKINRPLRYIRFNRVDRYPPRLSDVVHFSPRRRNPLTASKLFFALFSFRGKREKALPARFSKTETRIFSSDGTNFILISSKCHGALPRRGNAQLTRHSPGRSRGDVVCLLSKTRGWIFEARNGQVKKGFYLNIFTRNNRAKSRFMILGIRVKIKIFALQMLLWILYVVQGCGD